MQGLRSAAIQDANTLYIDCADIPGTDCYCDDEAAEVIRKRIAEKFGYSLDAIFDAGIKEQREAEARGEKLQFARLPIARPFFT